jgi:glycosyltransferase involved in cell wall biosynthesis
VIVSRRSAYAAMVRGGAGITFDPEDTASLAAAIRTLLEAPPRREMGDYGRRVVERDYSWRRSAERYLNTYMQIRHARLRR